jgi:predicted nucleic acid-binding protein
MVSRQVQVVQLTCGELRAACKKRPGHDLALHFMKSLGNMPDSLQINIEQPDLEALLHNRRMVIRHQVIGDTVVMTKQVVDL